MKRFLSILLTLSIISAGASALADTAINDLTYTKINEAFDDNTDNRALNLFTEGSVYFSKVYNSEGNVKITSLNGAPTAGLSAAGVVSDFVFTADITINTNYGDGIILRGENNGIGTGRSSCYFLQWYQGNFRALKFVDSANKNTTGLIGTTLSAWNDYIGVKQAIRIEAIGSTIKVWLAKYGQGGTLGEYSKVIDFTDDGTLDEFTSGYLSFFCNGAGNSFVLDNIKLLTAPPQQESGLPQYVDMGEVLYENTFEEGFNPSSDFTDVHKGASGNGIGMTVTEGKLALTNNSAWDTKVLNSEKYADISSGSSFDNYVISVDVTANESEDMFALAFRATEGNAYGIYPRKKAGKTQFNLMKITDGITSGGTVIDTEYQSDTYKETYTTDAYVAGERYKFTVVVKNTNVKAYWNDKLVMDYTGLAYNTGSVGAMSLGGGLLWDNLTVARTAPFGVRSFSIEDDAVDVPVDTEILISFNDTVNAEDMERFIAVNDGIQDVNYWKAETSDSATVKLVFTGGLEYNKNYTVTLKSGIESLAGEETECDYVTVFSTVKDKTVFLGNISINQNAVTVKIKNLTNTLQRGVLTVCAYKSGGELAAVKYSDISVSADDESVPTITFENLQGVEYISACIWEDNTKLSPIAMGISKAVGTQSGVDADRLISINGNTGVISNTSVMGIYALRINDDENIPTLDGFAESTDKEKYFGYMGLCYPELNGDFEHSFKLSGESGDYQIYSVMENVITDLGRRYFLSDTEYLVVLSAINGKTGESLGKYIKGNAHKLSLNISEIYDEKDILLLADNVEAIKPVSKIADLNVAVAKTKTEIGLLNEIKNTDIWQQINPILTSQNIITVDFTYYNLLNASKKALVDSELVKKRFSTPVELKNTFESKAKAVFQSISQSGGSSGGGGASGGGGGSTSGGGSSSGGSGVLWHSGIIDAPVPDVSKLHADTQKTSSFNDISSVEWAREAIEYLSEKKIISGKGDGNFAPDDIVTREEIVKIIVSAYGITDEGHVSFNDVSSKHWSKTYIQKAVAGGIINGISDTEFGLGKPVTREDLCVILYRAAGLETGELRFKDSNCISDYAKDAVGALCSISAINGYEDGNFKPKGNATRAEAAVIIYRLLTGGGK